MSIKVWDTSPKNIFDITFSTFPGGEEFVRINTNMVYQMSVCNVEARIRNSSDLMRLIMLTDALRRMVYSPKKMVLYLYYVPYARQDRVCNVGESHSARVFCDMINNLNYDEVVITDPHSDVVGALLNNVLIYPQAVLVGTFSGLNTDLRNGLYTLVSPDAGSQKKIGELSKMYQLETIRADKVRDILTGDITHTHVDCDDLNGRNVLIVDDICDGGRTFIELAKVLKAKGAGKVGLYVTHGIFSKGIEALYGYIDIVYTTDSFNQLPPCIQSDGKNEIELRVKEL